MNQDKMFELADEGRTYTFLRNIECFAEQVLLADGVLCLSAQNYITRSFPIKSQEVNDGNWKKSKRHEK